MNPRDGFLVYRARELSPPAFGDPTIIVAAIFLGHAHVGEYFVLHRKDGRPHLARGKVTIDVQDIPADILPWKREHTLEETYQFALSGYRAYLESRFPQAPASLERLFQPPHHLVQTEKEHLARLWMRGEYHRQFRFVQKATTSAALASFVGELVLLPAVTRAR